MQQALRGGRRDVQRRVHLVGVLPHVQHHALAQRRRAGARALAQHALQLERVLAVAVRRQPAYVWTIPGYHKSNEKNELISLNNPKCKLNHTFPLLDEIAEYGYVEFELRVLLGINTV